VDRFSGNIDPIKGDFSGVAKSSRILRDGKDCGAVSETMIAGNLFEVLSNLQAVSNVQELVSGAILLPWVLGDHVSVTGE
jgi:PmbA protein